MCVVSMIYEHYTEKWQQSPYQLPQFTPTIAPNVTIGPVTFVSPITPEEIAEFRKLLERAREYDKRNNEPDCELDEKRVALKTLAEQLGVEIAFL